MPAITIGNHVIDPEVDLSGSEGEITETLYI